MTHRPPKNDTERLQNLIEALSEPGEDDDALDEQMHAELARRGLTLETWAAQIRAKAQAALDRSRRARRARALKIAAAAVALAAAVGIALALQASAPAPTSNAVAPASTSKRPQPPRSVPDAKVDPPPRK